MTVHCLFSDRAPKESESITDCQDFFEINQTMECFAIADGASQSFYPDSWAKLLVHHFCENPEISALNWKTWLEPIQARWFAEVKSRVETAKSQGKPTWIEGHNGLNMKRSATSTFIGLHFIAGKIKVCIVGDSCLFILKGNNLESYPLECSEDFNDRPEYLASYPKDNHFQPHFFDIDFDSPDIAVPTVMKYSRPLTGKDFRTKVVSHSTENCYNAYVILATDALSEYILKSVEQGQGQDIFSSLLNISSKQQFEDFVRSSRHQTTRMKNDDSTLLILGYSSSFRQGPSQIPLNAASSSSTASSVPSLPKTQITGLLWDRNRSNPVKLWFRTSTRKLLRFLTTSQDLEQSVPVSSRSSSKINHQLKRQRSFLIAMVFFLTPLSFWIGRVTSNPNQPTAPIVARSNASSRSIPLPRGGKIYTDQELMQPLIASLSNISEALILEEGDRWIKFQVELYAYKTIVNPCSSCSNNEIEILSEKNLRVLPNQKDETIFGILNRNTKFQEVESNSYPDWRKFRFVGYLAR